MNQEALDSRMTALESQVAQNERTIEELNEVVRRNGEEIDQLKAEIAVLGRQLLQLTEGEAEPHISGPG